MVELTEKEQAILDAACVRVEKAGREAQTLQQMAEQAARKAEALGHEARGIFRSLMELNERNPDAYQIQWDGAKTTIVELPQKEADNVVPLPAPKDQPAAVDA